jgi:hypothetical protein
VTHALIKIKSNSQPSPPAQAASHIPSTSLLNSFSSMAVRLQIQPDLPSTQLTIVRIGASISWFEFSCWIEAMCMGLGDLHLHMGVTDEQAPPTSCGERRWWKGCPVLEAKRGIRRGIGRRLHVSSSSSWLQPFLLPPRQPELLDLYCSATVVGGGAWGDSKRTSLCLFYPFKWAPCDGANTNGRSFEGTR